MGKECETFDTVSVLAHIILITLKLLYLIGLLFYLINHSPNNKNRAFVFESLDDVIKNMNMASLMIATLVGIALECCGAYGLWSVKWKPNLAYLLMHITVVPLYLYYSHFSYLCVLYAGSMVTSISLIRILVVGEYCDDDDDDKNDIEANRRKRSTQAKAPPARTGTQSQTRGTQNQTRGQRSNAKQQQQQVVASRARNLPKPKKSQARVAQNQTRGQNRSQPNRSQPNRSQPNRNTPSRVAQQTTYQTPTSNSYPNPSSFTYNPTYSYNPTYNYQVPNHTHQLQESSFDTESSEYYYEEYSYEEEEEDSSEEEESSDEEDESSDTPESSDGPVYDLNYY